MRVVGCGVLLILIAAMMPAPATARHVGPIDDPTVPGVPAVPGVSYVQPACALRNSNADVCVSARGGHLTGARVSTYRVAQDARIVTVAGTPVRVSTFGYGDGAIGVAVPEAGQTAPRTGASLYSGGLRASASAGLVDRNGDGLPDGVGAAPALSLALLGQNSVALRAGLVDSNRDGVPDSPDLGAGQTSVPPLWLPGVPNTPEPLPSLQPPPKAPGTPSVPGLHTPRLPRVHLPHP